MKYEVLDYPTAHAVVKRNRFLEWDGWNIVTWRRDDERGYSDRRGKFKNGHWGIQFTYPLQADGTWKVPENYVINSR